MNTSPRSPDLYVLDALANDIEDLESIIRMLNSDTALGWAAEWGRPFRRGELIEALSRLVAKDYVQVLVLAPDGKNLEALSTKALPPGSYQEAFFALTERGRIVHRNWDPRVEENDSTA
jgi:hypothetical protein